MWTLELSREATSALLRMPRDQALRIRAKLNDLVRDPYAGVNVKKLTDLPGFRLRIGDWRVVYLLDRDRIVIQVIRIAQRGEVYR
jgi:mRNA interferase RelE/StbE